MTAQRRPLSSPPDGRCSKWHRRPESRPQEILEAAIAVFGELGYERATIADVARRAGISPSLVVHYYSSKADLFEAAINDRFLHFVAGEEALLAAHRGPYRDLLHQLVRRFWEHACAAGTVDLALVVKAERANFPEAVRTVFQQIGERWRRLIEGILEAGVRQGEFRLSGPHVARVISSMVIGVVESTRCFGSLERRPSTPDELWAALIALLDGGVLTDPGISARASAHGLSITAPAAPGASRQQGESQ